MLIHPSKGSLSAISVWNLDRTKALALQIASKLRFSGEIAELNRRAGEFVVD